MLTLFHAPQSRSSRIIWLLEELSADYRIEYVDIPRQDGSGAPDPKNPHPDKKVPALMHDGALITESAAIALYLTDMHPKAGLGPLPGDLDRGAYLSWLSYYAGVIEPVIHFAFFGLSDNAALKRTFRGVPEMHQRLLGTLAHQDFLVGNRFSAADVLLASLGLWMRPMLPEGKVMDDYLARCNARPALQAANAKDAPPRAS
jgi:glutathione S-transferase